MAPSAPYRPPFQVTPQAMSLSLDIMKMVGRYEGMMSPRPQPKLRKANQIRTVVGSLAIEGNTLSLEQATAVLENKRVTGSAREIREVQNAIATYARASTFRPGKESHLLAAHEGLMKGLIKDAGRYRTGAVGIFAGSHVTHVAPPAARVAGLVRDVLTFVESDKEIHPLVRSAAAHYELEFIHPFSDGNGRVGRLWQHVVLLNAHPLFALIPIESVIHARQEEYYRVLGECDRAGQSSRFIEFSLSTIQDALATFLNELKPEQVTPDDRLVQARAVFASRDFSRKDYLAQFPTLSTATASRDLRLGVDGKRLKRVGEKALSRYRFSPGRKA